MLAVIVRYVVLGTALEEVSTILITVPVILPIVAAIGYDGIWFGIFVTAMATIGLISPPVGLTVFVIQAQNPDILAARISCWWCCWSRSRGSLCGCPRAESLEENRRQSVRARFCSAWPSAPPARGC